MPVRVAAICGLLAPLTYSAGLLLGGLAQPDAFSSADDAISDLGAETASSPWIYNQIGLNLTGILVVVLALGLWRALSPDVLGSLGAAAVTLTGFTLFLQGFFRLDCQDIDQGCENTSWHSEAHSWATGASTVFLFAAPIVLALAFRRLPHWRDSWLPSLAAVPAFIVMSILFSGIGDGASTRAGAITWLVWLAFVALQLLRKAEGSRVRTAI
jgi:hypothetical membrane protein